MSAETLLNNGGGEEIQPVMINVTSPSTLPAVYTFEAFT